MTVLNLAQGQYYIYIKLLLISIMNCYVLYRVAVLCKDCCILIHMFDTISLF